MTTTQFERFKEFINSGLSKDEYLKNVGLSTKYFQTLGLNAKTAFEKGVLTDEEYQFILNNLGTITTVENKLNQDINKSEYVINRDEDGRIKNYSFTIYRKNDIPLIGILTRDELQLIYRLYTNYGSKLTQKEVTRFFPEYSLEDMKKILNTFNIYKSSSPFPQHMLEEYSNEELVQIQLRAKEQDLLKTIDAEQFRTLNSQVNQLTKQLIESNNSKELIDSVIKTYLDKDDPISLSDQLPKFKVVDGKHLILYLADLHTGAKVSPFSLYENQYNVNVIEKRLGNIVEYINNYLTFDTATVVLLGDMLDGMDNSTARRDVKLPQNLDNYEQLEAFLEVMTTFLLNLRKITPDNNLSLYSVCDGNHSGAFEYAAIKALFYKMQYKYQVPCNHFTKFLGHFSVGEHTFICTHGKDATVMKRPMPLYLDANTTQFIQQYIDTYKIDTKQIHFIKGDLHQSTLSSSINFDYRNVLSVFGSSDYAMLNYPVGKFGTSFDIVEGPVLTRGDIYLS